MSVGGLTSKTSLLQILRWYLCFNLWRDRIIHKNRKMLLLTALLNSLRRRQKKCWWRLIWSNQSDTSGWTWSLKCPVFIFTPRLQNIVFQRELLGERFLFFFFFDSVSLDFLALWPRLSSSVLGGVTPGEEMKQQHVGVREFMSKRASLWSLMCVWCPTVAGRGTRRGGAHLWSRRGDAARRRKGKGRKRRRRSTHL